MSFHSVKKITITYKEYIDIKSMLQKADRDKEQSLWVSKHKRKYFPKSDGPIINVFNNKGKLIVMASKVMCFWKEPKC